MILIKETNGFIYLNGCEDYISWCDFEEKPNGTITNYFLLNNTTKEYFIRDILPVIKQDDILISQELLDKIVNFKQNQENNIILEDDITLRFTVPNIELEDHQLKALKYMLKHNQYGFFYGPGTGKTLIAIAWLIKAKPKSCLIVTPQKVVGQYKQEVDKYIKDNNYDVTNYEQLSKVVQITRSNKSRTYLTKVLKTYDAIIIDESHRAKNYSSDINVRLRTLANFAKYKYIFTGSPQDKSRHDILSQLAILDNRVVPSKTKTFQRYFRIDDYFNPKSEIRERKNELTELIKSYTIAEKTEDVVNLTKSNTYILKCKHPSMLYDELISNRVINSITYNGDIDYECVCDTPAILRNSLKEICCGLLTIKNIHTQETVWFKFDSPKTNKLKYLVENIPKGIIYYEYTESTNDICNVLNSLNKTYVVVNGKLSVKSSNDKIAQFKSGKVDYLVIQSKSGNAGLDLTIVHDIIFYSLTDSFIVYEQCKHRIRRYGQTNECNYYYLICEDTIEEKIYQTLQRKKSFNDRIFQQLLKEK